ncbi:MAG: tRNA (adenosine(37)-N6)-threonylcarbamoyltransferase complex transferase subunit TsaD [Clostridia bacterium]|nr:tRNA (adenosine(37)-N6)-threonylcarbamoyltransferase complex transferase subunit TsaD [Clostridia bacterium]
MLILGIESSCDETAAAVVEDGRRILSDVVASQVDLHALYGGVVPEIASRAHTEAVSGVVEEALSRAEIRPENLDAVAVTYAPGLIGALLTGVSFAKGFSYALGKPLIPVHHLRGHVAANYLVYPDLKPPFIALCVSGGNTELMIAEDYTDFRFVGTTRDDAAGEAFDKCARVLGLPYPGGAAMDRLASVGNPNAYRFHEGSVDGAPYDFSFSGLKTAVINTVHTELQRGRELDDSFRADVAASFTEAVIRTVSGRLDLLLSETGPDMDIVLAGGVAANSHLRAACADLASKYRRNLYLPPLKLCGDNAAMIASQGYYEYLSGNVADLSLNAYATRPVSG